MRIQEAKRLTQPLLKFIVSAALITLVVLFQNCSNIPRFSFLKSDDSGSGATPLAAGLGGGGGQSGGGFDGKPYIVQGNCPGASNSQGEQKRLVVAGDFGKATLVRDNCQDLPIDQQVVFSSAQFFFVDVQRTVLLINSDRFTLAGGESLPGGLTEIYDCTSGVAPSMTEVRVYQDPVNTLTLYSSFNGPASSSQYLMVSHYYAYGLQGFPYALTTDSDTAVLAAFGLPCVWIGLPPPGNPAEIVYGVNPQTVLTNVTCTATNPMK